MRGERFRVSGSSEEGKMGEREVEVVERRRYRATWKREFKLPWRKAGLLISMIKWTGTSRLSIKISLSL